MVIRMGDARRAGTWLASSLRVRSLPTLALACAMSGALASAQDLIGVHWDTGDLYAISPANGAATPIGATAVTHLADIEHGPDGKLYGLRVAGGSALELWRIDPGTAAAALVGPLGFTGFEGDLAFTQAGELYAVNSNTFQLLRIDIGTGAAVAVAQLPVMALFRGLSERADGKLAALEMSTNALLTIDPSTGNVSSKHVLAAAIGGAGSMTRHGGTTYLTTGGPGGAGGPGGSFSGSNELWTVDPFSGAHSFVASFAGVVGGGGITGLAGFECSAPSTYCTAGTSSHGCAATLSSTGIPTAGATAGFVVTASQVEGQRQGMFFYGLGGPLAEPWGLGTSWLCVKAPLQRTSLLSSGGTSFSCDGSLAIDWLAWAAAHPGAPGTPLQVGTHAWMQAWYRDPPSPKTTSLSNALRFVVCAP
jgi:hypothetical protein